MLDDFPGILSAASQSDLWSWVTFFSPNIESVVVPSSLSVSLLWVENVCLNEAFTRFGSPDCSTLARLCVWEAPRWTKGPLNAAEATASLVWSKERGWSWSAQTASDVSEIGLEGTGAWNLVSECLSEVLRHPVQLQAKSLSPPLLPSCDSQGRGFFAVSVSKDMFTKIEIEFIASRLGSALSVKKLLVVPACACRQNCLTAWLFRALKSYGYYHKLLQTVLKSAYNRLDFMHSQGSPCSSVICKRNLLPSCVL